MSEKAVLTEYRFECGDDSLRGLRIALAADLHQRAADDLSALLASAEPDIIAVAGDTLERYSGAYDYLKPKAKFNILLRLMIKTAYCAEAVIAVFAGGKNKSDEENSFRFLEKAASVAPVFMSLGNHEEQLTAEDKERLDAIGVTVIDNRDITVRVKGRSLRIGGLSSLADFDWLERFDKKDGFKLLLCHHPEYYDSYLRSSGFNLVLAGHAHGGQIRLRGRGLIAPGQGFFPKYTRGIYHKRLIVSAGCANTVAIPRFNNPREIAVIEFV